MLKKLPATQKTIKINTRLWTLIKERKYANETISETIERLSGINDYPKKMFFIDYYEKDDLCVEVDVSKNKSWKITKIFHNRKSYNPSQYEKTHSLEKEIEIILGKNY